MTVPKTHYRVNGGLRQARIKLGHKNKPGVSENVFSVSLSPLSIHNPYPLICGLACLTFNSVLHIFNSSQSEFLLKAVHYEYSVGGKEREEVDGADADSSWTGQLE